MRPTLFLAALLLAPPVLADTMYKCVDAQGKIAFSDTPCPSATKAAKQYAVPAPQAEQEVAARVSADQQRLRAADAAFRVRHAQRAREFEAQQARAAKADARARAIANKNSQAERDQARFEQSRAVDANDQRKCKRRANGTLVCI